MRIEISRTGGFAGISRHASVDTAECSDAEALQALADRALAGASTEPPVGVPDGFRYAITVDGKTGYCADPHLTDAQRELIDRVLRL
ncbi:metalloprotease [Streptomyces sp. NRRL F-4489]|uniref:protealysin inhibitor emfourin n=1 Tax=Streptomyces sp. NRRL F-4489 TaxID=1609095 RepID=UPI000747C308|nr:protealysin inhibitor emfourin [Streptomyces sp. NRRL F-4489]KUL36496.1 metalloprotease [Streptomyces sp. NRRL F-4489]